MYIFRNNTVEIFFANQNVSFSGYDDISSIPNNVESYIWFYQVPIKANSLLVAEEVDSYLEKFRIVHSQTSKDKRIIVFTLSNIFCLKFTDDDFLIKLAINRFNEEIILLAQNNANVKVLDIDEFFNNYDKDKLIDWKYYYLFQTTINPKLASAFRLWFSKKIDEIELKRKKCIVLDLDNTLWGGVLGEDGIDSIKIGGDYPGKAFQYFQESLIELSKHGIIITISSKNNENDVLELWDKNPNVILKNEYITSYRINWKSKDENIKELANELNIGLDSFVFIDDSNVERELVRNMLPEVEVPDFPEHPYMLPVFFESLLHKYFRIYSITDEDKSKSKQYKENAERTKAMKSYVKMDDFLYSLNIVVEINVVNQFNKLRIAQMTQKTNQFNLTTKRYTESDIDKFIVKKWSIYCANVLDKFGDNGITGVIILEHNNKNVFIDSYLLSCRVLGRGIEFEFLNSILKHLQSLGVETVYAQYIPTKKNEQVADFYDLMGFELIDEYNKKYKIDLSKRKKDIILKDYIKIIWKKH